MPRKNIVKTILINIIGFLILLLLVEWIMYLNPNKWQAAYIKNYNLYAEKNHLPKLKLGYYPCVEFRYEFAKKYFRPVVKGKLAKIKRPLLFFGCSYTYGSTLKEDQTLPYKTSKLTGRTAYNRGFPGAGPQLMLLQLQDPNFFKEIPDAQYVIYTYIGAHLQRLYVYNNCISPTFDKKYEANPRYEIKNGKLEKVKPKFLLFYSSFTVRKIQDYLQEKRSRDREKSFDLFLSILEESKKLIKTHYKNPKFVILLYKDSGKQTLEESKIKTLEKAGFIVIDAEKLVGHELTSSKYRAEDKEHPSEKAWNEVTPKLIKKLNL